MTAEPLENRFPWMRWLLPAVAVLQIAIVALLVWIIVNRPPEMTPPEPQDIDLTEVNSKLDDIASDAASAKADASTAAETIEGVRGTVAAIDRNITNLGLFGVRCQD